MNTCQDGFAISRPPEVIRDSTQIRTAAKTIASKRMYTPEVLDACEEVLKQRYSEKINDSTHVDAMAWLCKILGASGDTKYRTLLDEVSRARVHRKLRGYAIKSKAMLR